VGALKGRSLPFPRVQRTNRPCFGSLAPSGLSQHTFVTLIGTVVGFTLPFPFLSNPPTFGPQGLLISYPDRREKTATGTTRGAIVKLLAIVDWTVCRRQKDEFGFQVAFRMSNGPPSLPYRR